MGKKPQNPGQKQRRINLTKVRDFAAALYWVAKLILLLWDSFTS